MKHVRAPASRAGAVLERADRWLQRRRGVSFLVAVFVRYREDMGRQYGALLSYYGFVSLFPLLLVLVTVLGRVLDDNPDLLSRILDTVYARIPVVGAQLREDPASLSSSGVALAFGLLVSLWSGLAVVRIAGDALNLQWGVPRYRRTAFVARQVRSLGALAILGLGILAATALTSVVAFLPDLGTEQRVLGAVLAMALNVVVLTVSYRVLVTSDVPWRAFVPGGVVGGVILWLLQVVGGTYVARVIIDASDVFGVFATTFGLLVWIALVARATLLAHEINVVRAKRLWPRSLLPGHPTEADQRSYEEAMRREALAAEARLRAGQSDGGEPERAT